MGVAVTEAEQRLKRAAPAAAKALGELGDGGGPSTMEGYWQGVKAARRRLQLGLRAEVATAIFDRGFMGLERSAVVTRATLGEACGRATDTIAAIYVAVRWVIGGGRGCRGIARLWLQGC